MKQALALAWETHAHLSYVCVMTEPQPSASEVQRQIRDAVPPEADDWCQVEVVVKAGVPATEIVRIAESADVDLLVIGPPRQWTSTTQAVLAKSLCPVLVTHDALPLPYRLAPGDDALTPNPAIRDTDAAPLRGPVQSREHSTASSRADTAAAATKPAPPLEESDQEPDKYRDNDDGPDDARNRDEGLHKS